MIRILRDHVVLVAVSAAYLIAFAVFGFARGRDEAPVYLTVVGGAMIGVAFLRARIDIPRGVLWSLAAWGAAHLAGGLVVVGDGVLYNEPLGFDVLRYDRLVHAWGFGAATLVVWHVVRARAHVDEGSGWAVGTVVALAGMGVGAVNEIAEFFAQSIDAGANVGGYDNTGWDLIANGIGASIAAALAVRSTAGLRPARA